MSPHIAVFTTLYLDHMNYYKDDPDAYLADKKYGDRVKMILQVHDELVFEIEEGLVKEVAPELKKIMETGVSSKETKGVVCVADVSVGDNWAEMERLNVE